MTAPPEEALAAWDIMLATLGELRLMPVSAVPRTAAHAAYYTAFHAAQAVLLAEGDAAPRTHAGVARRFGEVAVAAGTAAFRDAARTLRRLHDLRLRADYGRGPSPSAEDAAAAVRDALAVIQVCAAHLGLSMP